MVSIRFYCRLLCICCCALFISSCSNQRLFINSELPVIAANAKFLILPTEIHGLSGSKAEKEAIFDASFQAAFADQRIPAPDLALRLKDAGFADVSWRMSHAMHQLVMEGECFSYAQGYQLALASGENNSKFRMLDRDVYQLTQWLKQTYTHPQTPEYIVIAHLDSMGVSQAGKLIKYRVIAGIYATEKQALERVVSYVTESPNQHKTILHDLDNLGFLLYRALFNVS